MRTAFFDTLLALAERDHRIHLIVGDLGFGVVEPFATRFPDRFLNAGVAEQNMTGIAAGMAACGKVVFTYSIANFPTLRCLEQIRNDICYPNANVNIVSVGGGFAYGALGYSHHATEDLAIMRALPGMTVVAPGDPLETANATRAIAEESGPCYLRLGRVGEAMVHEPHATFLLGKATLARPGTDITLISTGGMLETAMTVANRLSHTGSSARVLSMHTIRPLDTETILSAARETRALVTIEEHSIVGGLGSAVAECLAESSDVHPVFKRIGIPSVISSTVGSQDYLRGFHGLSSDGILASLNPILDLITPVSHS